MTKLSKIVDSLFSAAAIGIYITLSFVVLAFLYYTSGGHIEDNNNLMLKLLHVAHQKSIDLRLRLRGPRVGSPDVAILAIDERSIETLGRWPWPRQRMAEIIDRATGLGVRTIAFDIGYSEKSHNEYQKILSRVLTSNAIDSGLQSEISSYLEVNDGDKRLGDAVGRHADRLVMGAFFEHEPGPKHLSELCRQILFQKTEEFKYWDKEEVLLGVADPLATEVPSFLKPLYNKHFDRIAEQAQKLDRTVATSSAPQGVSAEQARKSLEAQLAYCDERFLKSDHDELFSYISQNWSKFSKEEQDFPYPSFEEWLNFARSHYLFNPVAQAEGWNLNISDIAEKTKHSGFFNAHLDSDGTIRRAKLVVRSGQSYMPSIALKAYLVANNYNAELHFEPDYKSPGFKKISKLKVTNNDTGDEVFSIPVDESGRLPINFAGPQHMFAYFSAADFFSEGEYATILQKSFDPKQGKYVDSELKVKKTDFLKNKILVAGATAIGIYDLRVTPFDENFPGVETHVNVIDNLLRRDFLISPPQESTHMLLFLFCVGLLYSFGIARLGAVSGLAVTVFGIIALGLIDKHLLFGNGQVIAIVFPLTMIFSQYTTMTFFKYFTEERKKRELKGTFAKYVSPSIVEEILSDPSKIELGGKKLYMTVFFSDVRGFTTISEKLDPRALSDLLNEYLTPMTELVFKNRGTLDKYMGDAIMAFWGAPIPYKDHAIDACRCALQSIEKLKELQKEFRRKNLPEIDLGIGLNTGEMSAGNMGSDIVRNYTVMGDAVNLASRLEGINKQYGTRIIISEFTYAEVKEEFICREIDRVKVKGKLKPVKIFELMSENELEPQRQTALETFNLAYEKYHQRDWASALNLFEQSHSLFGEDPVSRLYIERCQDYIKEAPGDDWDGVFTMKTK